MKLLLRVTITSAICLALSVGAMAQQQSAATGTPSEAAACPNDRPVDDFIAEIHKAKSKKANRNKNPMPDFGCVFGWCRETAKTPPTIPRTGSPTPGEVDAEVTRNAEAMTCNDAMNQAFKAAHNVEVGDQQFEEKHYEAALSRFKEADQQKSNDAAILVRLGRAAEKLNYTERAVQSYENAAQLAGPEKWVSEAKASVERMKKVQ